MQFHVSVVAGVLCAVAAWPAHSGVPDPQTTQDAATVAQEARRVEALSTTLASYREEIRALETEGGALNPDLKEPLLALGITQRAAGDHRAALESFERALQLGRVQDGLHHFAYVPLLELIIGELKVLGDGALLDRYYQHLYWLYRRHYRDDATLLLAVLGPLADERLSAYRDGAGATAAGHLLQAEALADRCLEIVTQQQHQEPALLSAALYRSALISYHLAADAADISKSFGELRKALSEQGRGVFEVSEAQARETVFQQNYLKGDYHIGRLLKVSGARRAESPLSYAEALVFSGDYKLVFRRMSGAMADYKDAWQVLRDMQATPGDYRRLFGTARPVEPLPVPGNGDALPAGAQPVDAVYDVTERGWPENIRIEASQPPDSPDLERRARLYIAGIRHRPRFEDARPVPDTGVRGRFFPVR